MKQCLRISFEGNIDKAPNGTFTGEGKKEKHTGGLFTLNTDPSSELSTPSNVTKKLYFEHSVNALKNLIF